MPLVLVKPGKECIIKKVNGLDKTRKFLSGLGFVVGTKVCVINEIQGNVIINVKGTRIALNRQLAQKLMVDAA